MAHCADASKEEDSARSRSAESEMERCCDGREPLFDDYEELMQGGWGDLLQQLAALASTVLAICLLVYPDVMRQSTLSSWVEAANSLDAFFVLPDAHGQGKAARQDYLVWKATAYKVLLFAAILVVIAALEQELQEVLDLFIALRSRRRNLASRATAARGGFDLSLVPQALLERWRARILQTQLQHSQSPLPPPSAAALSRNAPAAPPPSARAARGTAFPARCGSVFEIKHK